MVEDRRPSLGLVIEALGPMLVSLIAMLGVYLSAPTVLAKFAAEGGWQIDSLYGAIFNWSAIQTGFAFGVYGFVVGKNEGFVQEMRDKLAMKRFMGYVRRANIGGFALTIFSLPLTIINPSIDDTGTVLFFAVLLWFGLFVWTFLAFLRVAYGFGHLSSVRDQPEFYGAGS